MSRNHSHASSRLSIILVNHNGKSELKGCLLSLEENLRHVDHEVIVVDNDSSDGSQAMVRDLFPGVNLISCRENLGFSKANNLGLEKSQGKHLLFLNPDTIIYPGTIDNLLREMEIHPQVGGVGPAMLQKEGRYQVSFGQKRNVFYECLQKFMLNPYFRLRLKSLQKNREVGWLSGACLLLRREAIMDAGCFDETFFLFFEDIDLCFRLREEGWKLFFVPSARIFHHGGASVKALKLGSRIHYRRSQIYFYQKHNSGLDQFLLKCFLYVHFCLLFLWGSLKRSSDLRERKAFFKILSEPDEKD